MGMQTSRKGKIFMCCREALVLTAYPDGGHPSAGFGHNDASLREGQLITKTQAFAWLNEDVAKWDASINKLLRVALEQHQFDAIASLNHQAGNRYMPAMVALCNAREFAVAAALFPLCDRNKAGEQMAGLHKRRLLEQAMFESGDYGDLSTIPFWPGDPKTTARQSYTIQPGDL